MAGDSDHLPEPYSIQRLKQVGPAAGGCGGAQHQGGSLQPLCWKTASQALMGPEHAQSSAWQHWIGVAWLCRHEDVGCELCCGVDVSDCSGYTFVG